VILAVRRLIALLVDTCIDVEVYHFVNRKTLQIMPVLLAIHFLVLILELRVQSDTCKMQITQGGRLFKSSHTHEFVPVII